MRPWGPPGELTHMVGVLGRLLSRGRVSDFPDPGPPYDLYVKTKNCFKRRPVVTVPLQLIKFAIGEIVFTS